MTTEILFPLEEQENGRPVTFENFRLGLGKNTSGNNSIIDRTNETIDYGLTYLDQSNKRCFKGKLWYYYKETPYSKAGPLQTIEISKEVLKYQYTYYQTPFSESGYSGSLMETSRIPQSQIFTAPDSIFDSEFTRENSIAVKLSFNPRDSDVRFKRLMIRAYNGHTVKSVHTPFETGSHTIQNLNGSGKWTTFHYNEETGRMEVLLLCKVMDADRTQNRLNNSINVFMSNERVLVEGYDEFMTVSYIGNLQDDVDILDASTLSRSPGWQKAEKYKAINIFHKVRDNSLGTGGITEPPEFFYNPAQRSEIGYQRGYYFPRIPMKVRPDNGSSKFYTGKMVDSGQVRSINGTVVKVYNITNITVHTSEVDVNPGDVIIIASDTLSGMSGLPELYFSVNTKAHFLHKRFFIGGGFLQDVRIKKEFIEGKNKEGELIDIHGCNTDFDPNISALSSTTDKFKQPDPNSSQGATFDYIYVSEGINYTSDTITKGYETFSKNHRVTNFKRTISLGATTRSGAGG